MKKIRLELEALEVESFEAGGGARGGTVHGLNVTADSCEPCEPIEPDDGTIVYCPPPPTAGGSCGGTCYATCTCGCYNTRVGWTCDPNQSECYPVPENNPPIP